jgi:glucosamine-6-phosphate deaminase
MRICVERGAAAAASVAANWLAAAARCRPEAVLALPTGRTPLPVYRRLIGLARAGGLDWRRVHVFNLDEFAGLGPDHPGSFARYLRRHVLDSLDLPAEHVHLLRGDAHDLDGEAARYERDIAACGGLDAAIVGIGSNGHIGFNEPGAVLEVGTHVARLTPATRRAYAPAFEGAVRDVPRTALTMGMGTILRARRLLLMATGADKASIVARALDGRVRATLPASFLQLHADLTVVLDWAAAAQLQPQERSGRMGRPHERHRV